MVFVVQDVHAIRSRTWAFPERHYHTLTLWHDPRHQLEPFRVEVYLGRRGPGLRLELALPRHRHLSINL